MRFIFIFFTTICCVSLSYAQKDRIELLRANKLKNGSYNGEDVNRVLGNVAFKHKGSTLYCDSAYQYVHKNVIECFGHVRIDQGRDGTLYGDHMVYNGDNDIANLRGDVKMKNKEMTLYTKFLDYNMNNRQANYFNGGRIVGKEFKLTSDKGYYQSTKSQYAFKSNVVLIKNDYTITTDTLLYNEDKEIAYFVAPTKIVSKDKKLSANKGQYNLAKEIADFSVNARIETPTEIMIGDSIHYESKKENGYGKGNVLIVVKDDSTFIYGDQAYTYGEKNYSKVFGNAVVQKISKGDTLFVRADTLLSYEETKKTKAKTIAFPHAKVFKRDIQAMCDSLVYNEKDSSIYLFRSPVLWNEKSQITSDSMRFQMANDELEKLYAHPNAFIISHDTTDHFNQIKGRKLVAYFKEDAIQKVDVKGNGQSIYFAHDDDDKSIMGMNKVSCSNMQIHFKDNELNNIVFLTKPDATFTPPHELSVPEKRFKNFKWLIEYKPPRSVFIRQNAPSVSW